MIRKTNANYLTIGRLFARLEKGVFAMNVAANRFPV